MIELTASSVTRRAWRRAALIVVALAAITVCGSSCSREPKLPDEVTYVDHIEPILFENCVVCHRPGQSAPFFLRTYAEASNRAELMHAVTRSGYMPPWLPEEGLVDFHGERKLTDHQRALLARWAETGAIEGDVSRLAQRPEWPEGWQLGEPDLVIELEEPYVLRAGGNDVFRNLVMSVPLSEPRYVKAFELRAGNNTVVHHARVDVDKTRESRRRDASEPEPGWDGMDSGSAMPPDGFFLGWTPGKLATPFPDGLAWRFDPGTDLILQLHMLPSGRPEAVRPVIGLYFTDEVPTLYPTVLRIGNNNIDIPAGVADYTMSDRYTLPDDVQVLSVYPHAHYLGKEIRARAILPDGSEQWLLRIDEWDFNWQDEYRYAEPIDLPAGTIIEAEFVYDNSSANVRNPHDPPERVLYGLRSSNEMGDLILQVVLPTQERQRALNRHFGAHDLQSQLNGSHKLLIDQPERPGTHSKIGMIHFQQGRADLAIRSLEEALRFSPDFADAHVNLGNVYLATGDVERATHEYELALATDPDLALAHVNLGNVRFHDGDVDAAAGHYEAAVATEPELAVAHAGLAQVARKRGQLESAIDHYQRSLVLDPDLVSSRIEIAALLVAVGRPAEAIPHLRRVLVIDPTRSRVAHRLGTLLERAGDQRGAVEAYRRALAHDPDLADTHVSLGEMAKVSGDGELARRHYELALEARPELGSAHLELAGLLKEAGDVEEAIDHFESALRAGTDRPEEVHFQLAALVLSRGQVERALEHYLEALHARPDWPAALTAAAWLIATTQPPPGSPDQAVAMAEQAAQITGYRYASILDTLGAAYASAGRFREAVAAADQALGLASQHGSPEMGLSSGIRKRRELYLLKRVYTRAGTP